MCVCCVHVHCYWQAVCGWLVCAGSAPLISCINTELVNKREWGRYLRHAIKTHASTHSCEHACAHSVICLHSLSLSDSYAFHANQVVGSNLYLSVVFDIIFKQPSVCNCDFALTKCNVCTKQTWPKPLTVCDTHIRGNWGGMRYCAQYDSYIPFMTGQYNTQKRRLNEYIEIRSGIRTLTTVNKLSVCHARRAQQAC